jgi:hypothetical protein
MQYMKMETKSRAVGSLPRKAIREGWALLQASASSVVRVSEVKLPTRPYDTISIFRGNNKANRG